MKSEAGWEVMKVLPEVFCSGAERGGVDYLSPPPETGPRELSMGGWELKAPSKPNGDLYCLSGGWKLAFSV